MTETAHPEDGTGTSRELETSRLLRVLGNLPANSRFTESRVLADVIATNEPLIAENVDSFARRYGGWLREDLHQAARIGVIAAARGHLADIAAPEGNARPGEAWRERAEREITREIYEALAENWGMTISADRARMAHRVNLLLEELPDSENEAAEDIAVYLNLSRATAEQGLADLRVGQLASLEALLSDAGPGDLPREVVHILTSLRGLPPTLNPNGSSLSPSDETLPATLVADGADANLLEQAELMDLLAALKNGASPRNLKVILEMAWGAKTHQEIAEADGRSVNRLPIVRERELERASRAVNRAREAALGRSGNGSNPRR